jgi:hypothetical protein
MNNKIMRKLFAVTFTELLVGTAAAAAAIYAYSWFFMLGHDAAALPSLVLVGLIGNAVGVNAARFAELR